MINTYRYKKEGWKTKEVSANKISEKYATYYALITCGGFDSGNRKLSSASLTTAQTSACLTTLLSLRASLRVASLGTSPLLNVEPNKLVEITDKRT